MKWEYRIISAYSAIETFDELGEDGWELVYIYDNDAYFKRTKENISNDTETITKIDADIYKRTGNIYKALIKND